MTTPLLIQNAPSSVVIYLELSTGLPATGLAFTAVTTGLKKAGGGFASFTLSALNWTDLTGGFYEVDLAAGDVDTLGSLYMSFVGSTIKTYLLVANVSLGVTAPALPSAAYTPTSTTIFGYIYKQTGVPSAGATVLARIVQQPTILHPVDQGVLITSEFLTTTTDSTGFFSLDLLTGTQVEFIIADANYRRIITVPTASSNLFDIP